MAIIGQQTLDQVVILEVDTDPTVSGVTANIGSIATLYDGVNAKMWLKAAAANTGWFPVPRLSSSANLTVNSPVYPNAAGDLVNSPTQFILDPTNGRIGIGTAAIAPVSTIHVDNGTGNLASIRFTAGSTTGQTNGDGTVFGIGTDGTAYIWQYENSQLVLATNNTRTGVFTPAGQFLLGNVTSAVDITGASAFPQFQIIGTTSVQMAGIQYSADTIAPVFNMLKSRGATVGTQGLLSLDDELGRIQYRGSDGVNFQAGASIRALVDGTAAAGSMPGRLIMMTTPTGTTTPVERMRISQNGLVRVVDAFQSFRRVFDASTQAAANTTTTLTSSSAGIQIFTGSTAGQIVKLPDATTLVVGAYYEIKNSVTTTTIALQDNAGTALATIGAVNGRVRASLLTNGTAAGTWWIETSYEGFRSELGSSTSVAITSGTDVLVTGMTVTPPAGTYLVTFTCNGAFSNTNTQQFVSIYAGGTQDANSEMMTGSASAGLGATQPSILATNGIVTVNGSQAIEIRARRSANTFTITQRNMCVVRVG